MGLFDEFQSKESKTVNQTFSTGPNSRTQDAARIYETGENIAGGASAEAVKGSPLGNWYRQRPYAFEFGDPNNSTLRSFYLPISPSNINITTHFATNVISTMYGTVEEHSEQRYYDITISGTTGMSPRYYKEISDSLTDNISVIGRAGTPISSRVGGRLGGFLKRTQALVENALNQANDLISDEDPTTGVDLQRTGYAAFHNFYKFLLTHKRFASGQKMNYKGGSTKTLRFLNYKDNNMYDVAIQQFQLTRDASNPMLYNYNIVMRAYNMRTVDSPVEAGAEISSRAAELGLVQADGEGIETSSAFSKLSNKARQAKGAAYSALGAIRGFGQ